MASPIGNKVHEDLLPELDNVTEQLTKTRDQLWKTQDHLKGSEEKVQLLETHITELVSCRENDEEQIKNLQEENSKALEEEAKVRESLDLMKRVFTRTQLKSKEDQETLMLLQEERDLLLEENKHIRESCGVSMHDKAAISRIKQESLEKEKQLTLILEKTKKDLEKAKAKEAVSDQNIMTLTRKLTSMKDPSDAERKLERQGKKIDALELQLQELKQNDDELLRRAVLDEDLSDSVAGQFMKKLDCSSLNDDLAANAYSLIGYRP
jgi:chromosome segregation ATPase